MATFVLVPGGWSGGWQWKDVGKLLQQAGHDVYRPTLTGLGERVHLASPDIDLNTHILDIVNLIKFEALEDVVLVGYSYSGIVVTGVVERIPRRIRHLAYFDGLVPEDGQSLADMLGPEVMAHFRQAADDYGGGWQVPHDPPDADRPTPQPLRTAFEPVSVTNPAARAIPRTFIHCTVMDDPPWPVLLPIIRKARQAQADPAWHYREISAEHGSFWETHAREAADLLLELA